MTPFIPLPAFPKVAKIRRRQKLLQIPAQGLQALHLQHKLQSLVSFWEALWSAAHSEMPTLALPVLKNVHSKKYWSFTRSGLLTSDLAVKASRNNNIPTILFFPVPEGQF